MRLLKPSSSPQFSWFSIALTVLFLSGLGVLLLFNGGSVFNPGPLSAVARADHDLGGYSTHADFEERCFLCHQPLKMQQGQLCLACHTSIQEKIDRQVGVHGRSTDPLACAGCHSEHQGRQFDALQMALDSFDHQQTGFPVDGAHSQAACAQCHQQGRYDQADPACVTCHDEPFKHAGLFGVDCAGCHATSAWLPASYQDQVFDHAATAFSLVLHQVDQSQQPMRCITCHVDNVQGFDAGQCIHCHTKTAAAFMETHIAQFGNACLSCHDGVDRMHDFDHARLFPLEGKHASLACESCHAPQNFSAASPECASCHQEPEIHRGVFGLNCVYCHTAEAWQPANLHFHTFPLDHGRDQESTCQTCHTAGYDQYTCYTCHEHDPDQIAAEHREEGISAERLAACAACHPTGREESDGE